MNLLLKALIIAVVVIAVVAAVTFTVQGSSQPVTRSEAVANVTSFLLRSNPPGTQINITSITPSQYSGSWSIVAGVVQNATSPCPSYYVYSFDYPQYGLVYRLDNNYTSNCIINGLNSSYVIGYYPVAVARSYSLHIPVVMNFVNKYGYGNVTVRAQRVASQDIGGKNYTGIWVAYYTSSLSTETVQVYMQSNGTLITAT